MRARHCSQHHGLIQPSKGGEFRNVDLVGAARFLIDDVGEPFKLGRNVGEVTILGRCQGSPGNRNQLRGYDPCPRCLNAIMYFIGLGKSRDGVL